MPTDTQRAPTLAQCIEREREAAKACIRAEANSNGDPAALLNRYHDARAATDEAVRAVEADVRLGRIDARGLANLLENRALADCAGNIPLTYFVRRMIGELRQDPTPAPTAQGESTGGESA